MISRDVLLLSVAVVTTGGLLTIYFLVVAFALSQ